MRICIQIWIQRGGSDLYLYLSQKSRILTSLVVTISFLKITKIDTWYGIENRKVTKTIGFCMPIKNYSIHSSSKWIYPMIRLWHTTCKNILLLLFYRSWSSVVILQAFHTFGGCNNTLREVTLPLALPSPWLTVTNSWNTPQSMTYFMDGSLCTIRLPASVRVVSLPLNLLWSSAKINTQVM